MWGGRERNNTIPTIFPGMGLQTAIDRNIPIRDFTKPLS